MAHIRITQTRSIIKTNQKQKDTVVALGLGRPGYSSVKPDNAQIRGMISIVNHLVKVEEISE